MAARSTRFPNEVPYLHVRPLKRVVVGVGGEGDLTARITGNRAGLLALRGQADRALKADEILAVETTCRQTDERRFRPVDGAGHKVRRDGGSSGAREARLLRVHLARATQKPE